MNPIFKIDYNRLVVLLLPVVLRKNMMLTWLQTLITPIKTGHGRFVKFYADTIKELNTNGQVCYLQKRLNDDFDPSLRRIYISDSNSFQRLYIYTKQENAPLESLYIKSENIEPPYYVYTKEDFADSGCDFYVNLNGAILTKQKKTEMKVLIEKNRLITKQYIINE